MKIKEPYDFRQLPFHRTILPPCGDCTDRCPGCHGQCDRYKAFKADVAKAKAFARQQRSPGDAYEDRKRRQIWTVNQKTRGGG